MMFVVDNNLQEISLSFYVIFAECQHYYHIDRVCYVLHYIFFIFLQISHSILDNGNGFFCFCIQDDGDDENEVNILRKKVKIDRERKKRGKDKALCNMQC